MRALPPLAALFLFAAGPALAHPGHAAGLSGGFLHPFVGVDHLLAMVAVGLWAGLVDNRSAWAWPATFAGFTLGGFVYALLGGVLPGAEGLILASVVGLGLAVMLSWRAPVATGSALIALLALAHGFAHGSELGMLAPGEFALGMTLATLILHAGGVGAALALRRLGAPAMTRAAGLGIAAGGLALVLAG